MSKPAKRFQPRRFSLWGLFHGLPCHCFHILLYNFTPNLHFCQVLYQANLDKFKKKEYDISNNKKYHNEKQKGGLRVKPHVGRIYV